MSNDLWHCSEVVGGVDGASEGSGPSCKQTKWPAERITRAGEMRVKTPAGAIVLVIVHQGYQ